MAYVHFSGDTMHAPGGYAAPSRVALVREVESAEPAGLSGLEWSVVALARRDRMASLARPGRLSVALGSVFGAYRTSPHLADPKLEALRRMAVLSWHRGFSVPAAELKAFLRAGFSASQYETLLASISAARMRMKARA